MESTSVQTDKGFPASMSFQKTWRVYQGRILSQFDSRLPQKSLHIVAAPGSGKTVLGLEIVRRLNQPTLVLAPTLTIRDQWVDRLMEQFLAAGEARPSWVSTDLRSPALLTITTYQALHSLCSGEVLREPEPTNAEEHELHSNDHASDDEGPKVKIEFPQEISEAGFRTLVVDEAHHLRAVWWKTLILIAEHLEKPTIVALTATPPYDVSPFEWHRYEDLCGPVDAEVSVPELVRQGDLCPHQDYVYFSTPDGTEQKSLTDFRVQVNSFVERLQANSAFAETLAKHRWVTFSDSYLDAILDSPEYLSSMIIYLNAVKKNIPPDALHVLGMSRKRMPALDLNWLEILLSHCLYSDAESFAESEVMFRSLRHELLEIGAIDHRRVRLRSLADHTKLLTTSATKLKSIEEIVKLELGSQGADLRCVVLTDFIRKDAMPRSSTEPELFEDIGIVPIFETLRQSCLDHAQIGVLTGSMVIVPAAARQRLQEIAAAHGIRDRELLLAPLPNDHGYFTVQLSGQHYQGTVRLITALFEEGGITVLVGTKSLLGEGWDAPCINTLILASFVGSYMLSNQMRGRSIRVDAKRPDKTANIWHLVCLEPGIFGPGQDYELLVRRCSAFAGVSMSTSKIETGTERLGLGEPPFSAEQIAEINSHTCDRARDRTGLRRRWQEALDSGIHMANGVKAQEPALPRDFVLANTIAALVTQAAAVFLTVVYVMLRGGRMIVYRNFMYYMLAAVGLAALGSLPWAWLAFWRFIRHGTPEGSIKQIGNALLESLEYEGSIDSHCDRFRVYADKNDDGSVFCWIGGGTGLEQTTFMRALREVLEPIDNPRFLLARKRIWYFFREDYFAVPDSLARKQEFAEVFAQKWSRFVGPVQLVYTRTLEGRKFLLRARTHSLSGASQKRSERVSCWK